MGDELGDPRSKDFPALAYSQRHLQTLSGADLYDGMGGCGGGMGTGGCGCKYNMWEWGIRGVWMHGCTSIFFSEQKLKESERG